MVVTTHAESREKAQGDRSNSQAYQSPRSVHLHASLRVLLKEARWRRSNLRLQEMWVDRLNAFLFLISQTLRAVLDVHN